MTAPLTSPLGGDDLAKALRDAWGRGYAVRSGGAPDTKAAYDTQRDAWIAQYMARLPAAEQKGGFEPADLMGQRAQISFTCAARKQGSAGGNDPADCDWPVCGCDPYADKVIASLQESGLLASAPSPEAGAGGDLTGYAEFTPITVRSSTGAPAYGDVSDRDLIAAVEPVLQEWIDWCGRNDETPEAHSGAVIAVKAIRAALAPSDAPSTTGPNYRVVLCDDPKPESDAGAEI